MFRVPLFRIILKTQSNNNRTKTITPIYNIPIGKGGGTYNIFNLAPIYTPQMGPPALDPPLAPYLWGASPPLVSPLIYGFERPV